MANICDNRFILINEGDDDEFLKIKHRLIEIIGYDQHSLLSGEITYEDEDFIEGYFESRWVFPEEIMKNIIPEETNVYFRCLSEEYGCEYVAMNVYSDKCWREEQTFDF